jgi:acetyl esterase/lipase
VVRDEGEAYARLLDEAGVDVTNVRYIGAIHDFALLNALRTSQAPTPRCARPPRRSRTTCADVREAPGPQGLMSGGGYEGRMGETTIH